jgi:L-seryl-tRNA(Ser) seleniumtransferase
VRVAPVSRSAQQLAAELRIGDPAILARVHEDALLFDVRTLEDEELELVAGRLRSLVPGSAARV